MVRYASAEIPRGPLPTADLLIDGLLGYSARGAPRGLIADIIRAAATVTLALPKRGLLASGARDTVGELLLADIGIPHVAFARVGIDTRRLFVDGDLIRVRN